MLFINDKNMENLIISWGDPSWEKIIDFTEINQDGVSLDELLSGL